MRVQRSLIGLSWLLLFYPPLAAATYWTVTSYLQVTTTTTFYSFATTGFPRTRTLTAKTDLATTPTAPAISRSTLLRGYEDLTIIYVFLPDGTLDENALQSLDEPYNASRGALTEYYEPFEYTAPPSCSKSFTFTTFSQVHIPSEAAKQVTPTSVTTSTGYGGYVYVSAYLAPGVIPVQTTAGTTGFIYSYYIANCRSPSATASSSVYNPYIGGSGSTSGSSSTSYLYCSALYCTTRRNVVIICATIFPGLFLLGFAESAFWFRRLMLGKGCLRGATISWVLITLWALCFIRSASRRSKEDQAALRVQWEGMSFGRKWSLWWRWGFRHRYPEELLGPEPGRNRYGGTEAEKSQQLPPQQPPQQPLQQFPPQQFPPQQFPPQQFPPQQFPPQQYPPPISLPAEMSVPPPIIAPVSPAAELQAAPPYFPPATNSPEITKH
ncbi:MAG: hypothetical protein M1813_008947 [Trichoglossum hirsutum]|nr:MAG: hypothetical protein M1813_008947 [Trichoglossum hirsutum]